MSADRNVRLFKPSVGEDELDALKDIIDQAWLGLGARVNELETAWAEYVGCSNAIGLNSGTAALHLALSVYGFPPGAKVLVPALTFASTAAAPIYNGLEPVFVDCDSASLTIDPADLEAKYSADCVAVLPVHFGGEPCQMPELLAFARQKGLKVIEDCAHTQGGMLEGRCLGTWGHIGCFSFEEKKGMTCGDGGMACSDDAELLGPMRAMRWLGIDKDTWKRNADYTAANADARHWYYEIAQLGYKYNMNNVAAAIGLAQLRKLDGFNERKRALLKRYLDGVAQLPGLSPLLPYSQIDAPRCSYWLFGVRSNFRDDLIRHLKTMGIATGVHYMPIPHHPYYRRFSGRAPIADQVYDQICSLPLHPDMSDDDVDYVLTGLADFAHGGAAT